MKKCVIIGSGLGGLSCGYIMARNGYDVVVLEQGNKVGGCLQCFRRGSAVFDTGMHYIGSADKGQTLSRIMYYLEIDKDISLERLNPMEYDVISYKGERYKMANGREGFMDALACKFPDSRRDLEKYYDTVVHVASASAIHTLKRKTDVNVNTEYQLKSVNEVINGVVRDPILRDVLAGRVLLYAGEKNRTPFSIHALTTDFYNQSAFRIVGGSSKIADSLTSSVQDMGGEVLVNKKVVRIECDNSRATSVITEDGECYKADLVISAIHPASTVALIDSNLIRPVYRRRIEGLRNTTGAFTIYLKFRPGCVPYMNQNLFCYTGDSTWECENYTEKSWPKSFLYMHFCHEMNPKFAETGEILTYMNFEELKPWVGTYVEHRGESYEEFKFRKAEKVLAALEHEVPGIRSNIEKFYTSTPLTYMNYTGVPEGSMYGVAKDVKAEWVGRVSHRTRIPNLLLSGQSITCHGMLGVLAGSLMTCSEVLSMETIFNQLDFSE